MTTAEKLGTQCIITPSVTIWQHGWRNEGGFGMGFSNSWIAVEGLAPERALEALGMEVQQTREPKDMAGDGLYLGVS